MYITVNNTTYYIVDVVAEYDWLNVMLTTDASLVETYRRLWTNESTEQILSKFPVYVVACDKLSELSSSISSFAKSKDLFVHSWYENGERCKYDR